ncbi:dTDP-4-dehydrorhamnose 3,5-epimerase [Sporosarcina sp. FSL K6-3457]|uniref:dTDP-4-dehydrorhamnose 3,5-epimerase n=1 Tax=Sporosarcina sp. FSL K6-3457 TaxID=2978204 RepID=UPI0030FBE3B0
MIEHFSIEKLELEGAYLFKPFIAIDKRGNFIKDYSRNYFKEQGIEHDLKEVFYTTSEVGVIRAIHFQEVKQQAKLVRCIAGEVYDVIIDLRKESTTYGQWRGFYLNDENHHSLYIPEGFGHGYLVLKPSIVAYKCAEDFYGKYDTGIIWDDPDLAIDWPLEKIDKVILSDKDLLLQTFKQYSERVK